MTTPRTFFATLVAALLLIAGVNYTIARLAVNSIPRQVLRHVTQSPADVLLLGNSVMQAGIDEDAFVTGWKEHGSPVKAVNGGLGATGPVEHLLLCRVALQAQPNLRVLVYGCFDSMLTDPTQEDWWRLLGNNAMVFYTEPAVAARHETSTPLGAAAFMALGRIPMFVERGTLWARVERLRRQLGGLGLPPEAVNRFGRVADFQPGVAADDRGFRERFSRLAAERAPLSGAITEMLTLTHARGLKVHVVMMPKPPPQQARYRSPEWQAYVAHLRTLLTVYGADLIDADDWVQEESMFIDSQHLGPKGATEFSQQLGGRLARLPTR